MKMDSWSGLRRFLTVIYLFISIFWSFYSLRFKKLWHRSNWIEERREELYVLEARRFRHTAVKLGGLLIKLGQFFSTRVDILPQDSIRELSGLQDEVEAVPFQDIRHVAETEFSRPLEEIYTSVEEMPLASASLGQVHCAVLRNGEGAAIKILRPGIEQLVDIDLKAVRRFIDFLKLFTDLERSIDIDAIYLEFSDTLRAELDYVKEGHNAETIGANFADDPDVIVPRIYWEYTTQRVLTMEFMGGIKISNYQEIEQAGVSRKAIASKLLQTYIQQILIDGFFHADPHPGNLFVTPDGKLVLIDFGMVGTIPPSLREILVELVLALVKRDNLQVVSYLKRIGFLRYNADNELVARAVGVLLEEALGAGTDPYSADWGQFLTDLETLLYEQPFQIPAQFTFMGRALGTLYGLCVGLDPDINFLDEAKPYLKEMGKGEQGLWSIIAEKAALLGSSLVEIPPVAERVLRRMDRGEISLKLPLGSLEDVIDAHTRALKVQTWVILWGMVMAIAAYLFVNRYQELSIYCLYFSLLPLYFIYKYSRASRKRHFKAPPPHMIRQRNQS